MRYCFTHHRAWCPGSTTHVTRGVSHGAITAHWEPFPMWRYQYASIIAHAFDCAGSLTLEEVACDWCVFAARFWDRAHNAMAHAGAWYGSDVELN